MSGEIKEINNEIIRITKSVIVQVPNYSKFGGYEGHQDIYTMDIAKALYFAKYRKQSEGKWIWINQAKGYLEPPYGDTCKCSLCEFEIDVSESNYNFCPNCGAKMKGE